MKRITILVNIEHVPFLSWIDHAKYQVIPQTKGLDVTTVCEGGVLKRFFNAELAIGYDVDKGSSKEYGLRNVQQNRMGKKTMMELMVGVGITVPDFIGHSVNYNKWMLESDNLTLGTNSGEVLLKPGYKARGLGILVITSHNFHQMMSQLVMCDNNKSIELCIRDNKDSIRLLDKAGSDDERYSALLETMRHADERTLQVYKDNIIAEFRVLAFKDGSCFIYSRTDEYIAATPDQLDLLKMSSIVTLELEKTISNFSKLFHTLDYIACSGDIYVTEDGEVGMFEFSNEFAVDKCLNYRELRGCFRNSLDMVVGERMGAIKELTDQ